MLNFSYFIVLYQFAWQEIRRPLWNTKEIFHSLLINRNSCEQHPFGQSSLWTWHHAFFLVRSFFRSITLFASFFSIHLSHDWWSLSLIDRSNQSSTTLSPSIDHAEPYNLTKAECNHTLIWELVDKNQIVWSASAHYLIDHKHRSYIQKSFKSSFFRKQLCSNLT